jgi:hypothetical protein
MSFFVCFSPSFLYETEEDYSRCQEHSWHQIKSKKLLRERDSTMLDMTTNEVDCSFSEMEFRSEFSQLWRYTRFPARLQVSQTHGHHLLLLCLWVWTDEMVKGNVSGNRSLHSTPWHRLFRAMSLSPESFFAHSFCKWCETTLGVILTSKSKNKKERLKEATNIKRSFTEFLWDSRRVFLFQFRANYFERL